MTSESDIEAEIERYRQLYGSNRTGWHVKTVNPILEKYISTLKDTGTKIIVPLCGKSNDIPYLLNKGFSVFGIEGVKEAIEELGEIHNLNLEFDPSESLYYTSDKKLKIYNGNIFKCPIEKWGGFDCVWDRGSLSVFEEGKLREDYVEFMKRALISPKYPNPSQFSYLLEVYNYTTYLYDKPPRPCSPAQIQSLFGSWTNVKQLEISIPSESFFTHFHALKDHECLQYVYLLTRKQ